MYRIILCGYDFDSTEKIINKFPFDSHSISTTYVPNEEWRNDNLMCHIIDEYDGICPYIMKGEADKIKARTPQDAVYYIDWLSHGGTVSIDIKPDGNNPEHKEQCEALKFLKRLEETDALHLKLPQE